MSRLEIPHFNPAIATTTDNAVIIKLQTRDAIVMRRQAMDGRHLLQRPHPHRSVGTAGDKRVPTHLQLPDKRRMALQDGLAGSVFWVPDAHAGVETASCDPLSVKGDGVDLAEVAVQCAQAPSLGDTPDPGCRIVATGNYNIAVDLQAPDTGQMANENVLAESGLDIPYPQRCISRPRYRRVGI